MSLHYAIGNAADPPDRPVAILHIVNNLGMWGAGFTRAINARWGAGPERGYRFWRDTKGGYCQVSIVDPGAAYIVHLFAQHGVRGPGNPKPLDLRWLDAALRDAALWAHATVAAGTHPLAIAMPRIGCGLAGGRWEEVEPLVQEHLAGQFHVTVYDLEAQRHAP